ncbi:Type I restriction modification DNA specificity domain protein [Bacteroides cellulosilyticus]|uniref:Type I restriction modification DNA specificity domain protein n=1 Tax=Bacteroides cellulosilyticus TaxID=246787 RepID=A0A0P0GUK0_9BACE|nr:restriction endonuclease subunit S [Bacteroides cellulosilyticus]ALJ62127.1 Type I restriction modification DNA specificity domain protein [Bacteroides cellulosilyticus]
MTTTINNEHKKLNVPNLRFPEFQGEWEEYTLQDVVTFSNGKAHENCVNDDGDYILVNSKFVSTNGQVQKRVTSQLSPLHKYQFVMVMSDLPNGKALAKCFYVEEDNKYTLNQRVCSFTSNDGNVSRFLMYQINRNKYYLRFDDGINQTNLKKSEVLSCPVFIPIVREQEKIATLLCKIDERIATQNKIIDKLQSLIKGIAQKIVRSNKPNVRLYECVECSSSTQQESEVCEQGAYPVYGANGIVGYLDDYNTEGEAVYIIKDGSGVGTVSYVTGKCSATGTLNTLQAKDGYSLQYLYYLLKVFNFEPYKTGMAIPHIYFKDYGKAKVFCPSYTEQLQYARLLSAIDSKLSVEKNTLRNLSLLKQYLLRQMFI